MRVQYDALILDHQKLSDCEFEITLLAPEVAKQAAPGQFAHLLLSSNYDPFLRRPFSVYRVNQDEGSFSMIYLARGVFTQGLRQKRVGQSVPIVAPLGNRFVYEQGADRAHVLVAGGVGAPPLCFLAREMVASRCGGRIVVINGARSRSHLIGVNELSEMPVELHVLTDDGSAGGKGIITDVLGALLSELTPRTATVYACGPTAMLRTITDLIVPAGIPGQISVETPMPCALGVCMGCVVKLHSDDPPGFIYKRSCADGPIFAADQIIWEN